MWQNYLIFSKTITGIKCLFSVDFHINQKRKNQNILLFFWNKNTKSRKKIKITTWKTDGASVHSCYIIQTVLLLIFNVVSIICTQFIYCFWISRVFIFAGKNGWVQVFDTFFWMVSLLVLWDFTEVMERWSVLVMIYYSPIPAWYREVAQVRFPDLCNSLMTTFFTQRAH